MEFGSWTNGLSWGRSNAYSNYYLADPFLKLLKSGEVSEELLNEKVRRILRLIFRTTMNKERPLGSFGTEEHEHLPSRKLPHHQIPIPCEECH